MQVVVMHKKLEKCVEKYAWLSNQSVMSFMRNEWTLKQLLIMMLYFENGEKYFWNLDPICLPGLRSCSKQISNKWLFTTSVILLAQFVVEHYTNMAGVMGSNPRDAALLS